MKEHLRNISSGSTFLEANHIEKKKLKHPSIPMEFYPKQERNTKIGIKEETYWKDKEIFWWKIQIKVNLEQKLKVGKT